MLKDLYLLEKAGEVAGIYEIKETSVEDALSYFKQEMDKRELEFDENLFKTNYSILKDKILKHGSEKRKDMPVVSWKQIKDFQNDLMNGNLDIKKPFDKELNKLIGKYPKKLKKKMRNSWLTKGLNDGSSEDDKIQTSFEKIKVIDLNPVQEQIYLSKIFKNIDRFGIPSENNFITSKAMIVDSNNMIIDGHHRWMSSMIFNNGIKHLCLKVDLKLDKLLKVSYAYGVAKGNVQNENME
jgi:hypothetical protein